MVVAGLKRVARGGIEAIVVRECVRCVRKAPFEVLGRRGWISRVCGVRVSVVEEAGGCSARGEEVGAAAGDLDC